MIDSAETTAPIGILKQTQQNTGFQENKFERENEQLRLELRQLQEKHSAISSEYKILKSKYKAAKKDVEEARSLIQGFEIDKNEFLQEYEQLLSRTRALERENTDLESELHLERTSFESNQNLWMEKETQLKSKVDNLQVLIKDLKLVTNLSTDVSSESSPCQNFSHSPTKSAKCIRMTLFDEDGEKDVGKKIVTELKRKIDSLQTTIHEMEESAAHQIAGNETLVCQLKEDILQLKQVNHRLMEDAEQSNELLLKGCTLTSMESSVEKDLSNGFRLKSLSASTTVSSFKSSSNISNNHLIIGQLPDMNQNGSSGATLVGAEDEEDEDDVVDLSQISQIKSLQSENSELKEQIEALSDYIKKMVDKISGNEQLELAFMGGVNEKEEKERRNITNISFNNSLNASRKQAEIKSLHSVPAIDMISVDHHSGSAITTEDEEDEEVNEEEQAVNDDDLSAPVFRYKGYMIKM